MDGNEQINSNAKINESSKNNVISVKKSDFEVFEALAMDLASNTKSNDYNNTNNGSPKGVIVDCVALLQIYSRSSPDLLQS